MLRSAIVILLSIICGSAAAIGVYQVVSRRAQQAAEVEAINTRTVPVAKTTISRGEMLTAAMIDSVEWPEELVPAGLLSNPADAIGRVALTSLVAGEPLFASKLSEPGRGGFVSSLIKQGMRAYTIQASNPSTSVAGLVRPGDYVDVLLTLKGNAADESGGGSTITLLQVVEILAIDQILDAEADVLAMWAKGDTLKSVTLLVTPEQASLLSVGQQNGELSLSLRSGDDTEPSLTSSATIRKIQELRNEAETVRTTPVIVATDTLHRGQTLTEETLELVDWPEDLVPAESFSQFEEVVGRMALTSIMPGEPLFHNKLSERGARGFAASLIEEGMRAYTIQTSGPGSSVAGLVRPGDYVDVLLTLHDDLADETGGGSAETYLQSVNVLAVDQSFDPEPQSDSATGSVRGNTSVTLMVTPEQASSLSLAQHAGELSLSLRSQHDVVTAEVAPSTIQQIRERHARLAARTRRSTMSQVASPDWSVQDIVESLLGNRQTGPVPAAAPVETDPRQRSYIQTHRGRAVGRVWVHRRF